MATTATTVTTTFTTIAAKVYYYHSENCHFFIQNFLFWLAIIAITTKMTTITASAFIVEAIIVAFIVKHTN